MRAALSLSAFWFFYLAGLGVFFPYLSLYLRESAGLSGSEVGLVLAVLPLMGLLSQPFWGFVADFSGRRAQVIAFLAGAAALGQLAVARAEGFAALALAMALLAFFQMAVIPMAVAVSFAALRESGAHGFGRVRVWGTVGFLVSVWVFPRVLALEYLFATAATLYAVAAVIGLAIPRGGAEALRARRGDVGALLRHRPVVVLLLFALGAYLCLQGPMGIFAIWVHSRGGGIETVGNLWVFMLALEIPLIWYSGASLERLGPQRLLATGILAGGLRWTLCTVSDSSAVLYGAQLLHGVTVAGLILGGPLYLEQAVPERLRATAQGLLGMLGVGLGGIASNTIAGWLLENVGPDAPYVAGGAGALVIGLAVLVWLPDPTPAPAPV